MQIIIEVIIALEAFSKMHLNIYPNFRTSSLIHSPSFIKSIMIL